MQTSSFLLSLLSPVLRVMTCGNFRENRCKHINLDDVAEVHFVQLLRLACGLEIGECNTYTILQLGVLSERLQMSAVSETLEDILIKELRTDTCAELLRQCEGSGLQRLQQACYEMVRCRFKKVCETEAFLQLSEETIQRLLEEDELGASVEEDVFEALIKWIRRQDKSLPAEMLLRKIRYGDMECENFLECIVPSLLEYEQLIIKELMAEATAKQKQEAGEGEWDGVERLGEKWMVKRQFKEFVFGSKVLQEPQCVATDAQGRVLVSDGELNEIMVFKRGETVVRRIGSKGAALGEFCGPRGIAVDPVGNIIVADYFNHRIQVLNENGSVTCCFGTFGTEIGQLKYPECVAVDLKGRIVVADSLNHRIQIFDPNGSVAGHFGSKGSAIGQLNCPMGIAVDEMGNIVVADKQNHRIQIFDCEGSVVLCFGSYGEGPGQFQYPQGLAVNTMGQIFVTDLYNDRIQVFNADGSVVRIIGGRRKGISQLKSPWGVAVDQAGSIIVADYGNRRMQIF